MPNLAIFPLNTVLFPDGSLPLKLFEQRYLELAKECLREERPFGVCLIREGREVGPPAMPHDVGCTARITGWDMPQMGILEVVATGESRFRILRSWAEANGLLRAEIQLLPSTPAAPVPEEFEMAVRLVGAVIESVGKHVFAGDPRFDDVEWVANRLGDLMPFETDQKQRILERDDPVDRLRLALEGVEALAASG